MKSNVRNLVYVALFIVLITIGAKVVIPIPVCPFTLQLLFTTLAGLVLVQFTAEFRFSAILCSVLSEFRFLQLAAVLDMFFSRHSAILSVLRPEHF